MSHKTFDIIVSIKSVILSFTLAGRRGRGTAASPSLGMQMVTSDYCLDSVFYGKTFVGQPAPFGSTSIWKNL